MNLLSNHGNIIYKELVGKELNRAVSTPRLTPSLQGGAWFSSQDISSRAFDCPYKASFEKPLSTACFRVDEGKTHRVDTTRNRTKRASFETLYPSSGFAGDSKKLDALLAHIRKDELSAITGNSSTLSSSNSLYGNLDIYPAWNRHLPHN